MLTAVPPLRLEEISRRPPWAAAILAHVARPSPVPAGSPSRCSRTNGSITRRRSPALIPLPLSSTSTTAPAPVIRISAKPAGAGAVVLVEDNGKGISAGDRRRVMEPLVRLHRDGDPAGTGLGLATCARVAAAHGGRLEISSSLSGGTAVAIHLGAP